MMMTELNQNEKLYMLTLLDPMEEREKEAEDLIRAFASRGFSSYSTFVFTSQADIPEINKHIQENKSERFQYFLVDITENMKNGTFNAVINKKYYQYARQAAKIILEYKPKVSLLTDEERYDAILDQISKKGKQVLSPEDKTFLQDYSQALINKKSKNQ